MSRKLSPLEVEWQTLRSAAATAALRAGERYALTRDPADLARLDAALLAFAAFIA